jgi:hypothetical protein
VLNVRQKGTAIAKQIRCVGVLNDLHAGSRCGATPAGWGDKTNPARDFLLDCRDYLGKKWPKLDLLVLNGDLIDGGQQKSFGTGTWTTDLSEQAEMAESWLAPLLDRLRPQAIIRLIGTSYHEGFNGALKTLDKTFSVAKTDDVMDVQLMDGVIMNVKHEPEGGVGLYAGTMQDRELLWASITEPASNLPEAQFIVRAHLHMKGRHDAYNKVHVMCPCFQVQAKYAIHKKYYRWQPDIGGALLTYDPLHDQKYHVTHTTFPLPKKQVIVP